MTADDTHVACGGPCETPGTAGQERPRVTFEFDGAEGIAFWVTNELDEDYSVDIRFEDLDRLDAFLQHWFPGRYGMPASGRGVLTDPRKVAEFRRNGGGFGETDERWVSSATITDREVYVNGARVPWLLTEDGPRVEWADEPNPHGPRMGRLVLELIITDDDTIVTDTRKEARR